MPVILHPKDYDRWLSHGTADQPPVDLLRPYEADAMTADLTATSRTKSSLNLIAPETRSGAYRPPAREPMPNASNSNSFRKRDFPGTRGRLVIAAIRNTWEPDLVHEVAPANRTT